MQKHEKYQAQTPQNLALTKVLQKFKKTSTPQYYIGEFYIIWRLKFNKCHIGLNNCFKNIRNTLEHFDVKFHILYEPMEIL